MTDLRRKMKLGIFAVILIIICTGSVAAVPAHVGSITDGSGVALLSNPSNVFVSGNYAYVVSAGRNALEIVDVSNPTAPVHAGSITNGAGGALLTSPQDVKKSGNYAYVASYGSNALEIVDVSNPTAPADPVPGNKKAKKKKRPRGDPVQALSLPFKAVGSISNILSSGKDNGKFLNNLFKQSTGLVDSYLCLCNAEDPESFRKIARSVIGGQIVQNVVIGEIVTKKLMDSIDDREKLAPWMELKHRNDQQVLAAVDAMAKLTSLPGGAGKPSVTLNVANMLTGEKQVSHLDVIPKENRNDY